MGFWNTLGKVGKFAAPILGGPIGSLAIQGIGGLIGAKVGQKATAMAAERSPEELAALKGATDAAGNTLATGREAIGAGKSLLGQGKDLTQQGRSYAAGPANFYQTLLSGNRAAMSNLVAPAAAQIGGTYRGAGRALEHSGVRGAARDQQAGELNRQRASQIAGLTTGVQSGAAEGLAGLSTQAYGAGANMTNAGAGLYGTGGQLQATGANVYGNLLDAGARNRAYSREEGGKTAAAIGSFARDLGEVKWGKGKGPVATPAGPGTVPQGITGTVPGAQPTPLLPGTGWGPGRITSPGGLPNNPYAGILGGTNAGGPGGTAIGGVDWTKVRF